MCPVVYYEIRLFYYKLRQSFQNALILLQNASVQTVHKVDVSRKRSKKKYFTFNFYCSEQSTKVSLKAQEGVYLHVKFCDDALSFLYMYFVCQFVYLFVLNCFFSLFIYLFVLNCFFITFSAFFSFAKPKQVEMPGNRVTSSQQIFIFQVTVSQILRKTTFFRCICLSSFCQLKDLTGRQSSELENSKKCIYSSSRQTNSQNLRNDAFNFIILNLHIDPSQMF